MQWQLNLKYLLKIDEYLNLPIEKLDKKAISILKFHANNIAFILKGYSFRLKNLRKEISEIKRILENKLGIEISESIFQHIRDLKGRKKDERVEEFIRFLKNKYLEILKLELEELRDIDNKIKKIENKLLTTNNEKMKSILLKKKKELEFKKKLSKNPEEYINFYMCLFDKQIKENMDLIEKLVGKVMAVDYIQNTEKILEKKYELILEKLSKIYKNSRVDF